jgi:DNA-directed RNA polymerase specialized sigma24 family protein
MGNRKDRFAPPRGAKPPTGPVEPIDLYPNPITPRPPETRETILSDLHAGFASLTADELKVAQLWIYGRSLDDVCHFLKLNERTIRKLWRGMRRKLREALTKGNAPSVQLNSAPPPITGTPQETEGASPS